eukprot:662150-Hanusia_phi.AAC.1
MTQRDLDAITRSSQEALGLHGDPSKTSSEDLDTRRPERCRTGYGMPSDYVYSKIFGNSFDPDAKVPFDRRATAQLSMPKVSFLFYWDALKMMAAYGTSKRGIK